MFLLTVIHLTDSADVDPHGSNLTHALPFVSSAFACLQLTLKQVWMIVINRTFSLNEES